MAVSKLGKMKMWAIKISSRQNFLDKDRDFLAELVSEEARKVVKPYSFILHDMVESKRYCIMLIEGTKAAFKNLLSVINDNSLVYLQGASIYSRIR